MKQSNHYHVRDEFDQFTLHLDDDEGHVLRKREKKKKDQTGFWFYVGFASDLGYTISVPIVLCAFIGIAVDKYWPQPIHMALPCIALGCVLSIAGFIKTVRELVRRKN